MAPDSAPHRVTEIEQDEFADLVTMGGKVRYEQGRTVVVVPDDVYRAKRKQVARRRALRRTGNSSRRKNRA